MRRGVAVGHEWMLELVEVDDALRSVALGRHAGLVEEWGAALRRFNVVWAQGREGETPRQRTERDRALGAMSHAIDQTLFGLAGKFEPACWDSNLDARGFAPYAVLYLQWEAAFPAEWRGAAVWSAWRVKRKILQGFIKVGPLGWEPELTDLVMAAVRREQRCEDGWYAGLARHLDSPELHQRLAREMTSGEDHIRLRAGYVTAMLDDRRTPVRTKNWRRWLTMADS